ncbi:MAG: YfhO family protein [Clostridiales bacterium]|nr:YfhO family protein [Clostridiales bacterium]
MKPRKHLSASNLPLLATAFIIPVCIYLAVMLICEIVPFGHRTLLVWDANGLYASFLTEFRRMILGQADPFYTFHTALGSGTAGLISFHLASPWNVIVIFFKETDLPLAYSILVLLKIGFCGLTMMVFLRKEYGLRYQGLLFAVTYALMGYVAVYDWCVMWMDGVAALPLILLGLRQISRRNSPFLYILALAYSLFCNFYIGFMLCLFSLLYFFWLVLENRETFRVVGVFIVSSLLSAGLAAVMLIPAYVSVAGGYSVFRLNDASLSRLNSLFSVLLKFYTGAISFEQMRYGQPNIYIGIPVLVFAIGFFLNPAIPFRKRLIGAFLPGILLISFIVKPIYLMWHGFDYPNGCPARFSFLFCFVAIDLAAQGFLAIPRPVTLACRRRIIGLCLGILAFTMLAFKTDIENYLTFETIVLDVAVVIVTALIFIHPRIHRYRRSACAILCAMQVMGLSINAYMGYHRMEAVADMTTDQYAANITGQSVDLQRILSSDPQSEGLYRIEKNYHFSENESMTLNYPGLSHYSSATNKSVTQFADRIGLYHSYLRLIYGSGTTPVLDSLLGVKYILYNPKMAVEKLPTEYKPLWTDGDVTVYRNPFALPLALTVPAPGSVMLDEDQPFLSQNAILSDLTGLEIQAFSPVDARITADDDGFIYADIPIHAGENVYMLSCGAYYYLNDLPGENLQRFQGCILLPISENDTVYHLKMWSSTGIKPQFAKFSMDELKRAFLQLDKHGAAVVSNTASHLTISVLVDEADRQLLLTVPYDQGWSVWVDDVKQEAVSRYGALLAIDVSPGIHRVELKYLPVGLIPGIAISIVSFLLVVIWLMVRRRKPKSA